MTSSSSDGTSDGEQKRLLEAVSGIPSSSKQQEPSRSTKRSSKRSQSTVLEDNDTTKVVSRDMQTFLAKKLAEHLDSVYELVSPSHSTTAPHESVADAKADSLSNSHAMSAVKLFHDSLHPISLDRERTAVVRVRGGKTKLSEGESKRCQHRNKKKRRKPSESDSSESESEKAKLREAAVDASTLLADLESR